MQRFTRVFCVCSPRALARTRSKGSQANGEKDNTPLRRLLEDASSFGEASGEAAEPVLRWATQPYAARAPTRDERREVRVEPRDTTVLLFPGQGAQHVGMGRALQRIPAAKQLYELASSIVGTDSRGILIAFSNSPCHDGITRAQSLCQTKNILFVTTVNHEEVLWTQEDTFKWDVARVCDSGPEDELARRCQTAVLVTSLAALERVRDERPGALERVRAAAGFSLGEIAALVFADALSLERALRLVELRTAAMRAAAAARPGGMLTVWLAPDARLPFAMLRAREHAAEHGVEAPVCQVANYLYPACKVVAGDEEALRYLERHGSEYGVRRAARVRVEGAFHTPLMARAEAALREALRAVELRAPRLAVYSCVDGAAYRDAAGLRRKLARHVSQPVRWEQTLHALYARPRGESFPLTLALGPGAALRSTLRQVNARAWDSSLQIDV